MVRAVRNGVKAEKRRGEGGEHEEEATLQRRMEANQNGGNGTRGPVMKRVRDYDTRCRDI